MDHLSRMWYGVRTPELAEQKERRRQQQQQEQQQKQQQFLQQQQQQQHHLEEGCGTHSLEATMATQRASARGPGALARSPTSEHSVSHRKISPAALVTSGKELSFSQSDAQSRQKGGDMVSPLNSMHSHRKPHYVMTASTSPPRTHRAPRATVPAQPTGCAPVAYALRPLSPLQTARSHVGTANAAANSVASSLSVGSRMRLLQGPGSMQSVRPLGRSPPPGVVSRSPPGATVRR